MKKYLITFGDENYEKSLELLKKSSKVIGRVDSFIPFTKLWLQGMKFYNNNKFILDQKRGAGYWLWKPFIIRQTLNNINDGDIVIYTDAGVNVIDNLSPLYTLCMQYERLIFKLPAHGVPYHKAKQWIKGDCFFLMGCNDTKYYEADMTNGAISVWKKTKENLDYINEWLTWAKNPQIITDMPSAIPNDAEFRDHRHDQAILSNMRVKYDWEVFRDPTQYGEIEKGEFTNSPYPQLFHHHRNFKH